MNSSEKESLSEYETMDTLTLLRLHHKATQSLNSLSFNDRSSIDNDARTFETGKMSTIQNEWTDQRKIMDETKRVLMARGAKFNLHGIDLTNSSEEIQKLVKENGPE